MPKIFISHSWEDTDISRKLAEYLKRDNAEIWIDYARISGGDSLPEVIGKAIEWCDTMVLVWSKSAANSYYVKEEWTCAHTNQKRIIPCVIDNVKLPTILSSRLYIDFGDFEKGYRALARALRLMIKEENEESIVTRKPGYSEQFKHEPESSFERKLESEGNIAPKMHITPLKKSKKKWYQSTWILICGIFILFVVSINIIEPGIWETIFRTQVEQKELSKEKISKSKPTIFRNYSADLSNDGINLIIKKYDFFDFYRNKNGRDFNNQFKYLIRKSDRIVLDRATGLLWQQSGYSEDMSYENAKKWIQELNRKNYAGCSDWRLPTVEEAMSLIEREEKNKDLHIDPIFDYKQDYIWTSDLLKDGFSAWCISFKYGCCSRFGVPFEAPGYYVRAVRSVK
jgi:hypothetical protein